MKKRNSRSKDVRYHGDQEDDHDDGTELSSTARSNSSHPYSSAEWRERARREFHGWTSTEHYRPEFDPSWISIIWILLMDNLWATLMLVIQSPPFIVDFIKVGLFTSRENQLPGSIKELVDVDSYSRVSGRKVSYCAYADQREQHANSTDRAWLKVRYVDGVEPEECLVFAKCHARNWLIAPMMSIFGIYKNEVHAYSRIQMPVLVPRVHVARWTPSRFTLVLDDLASQQVYFPNLWETYVDFNFAKQVLTTLAKVHSTFWGETKVPDGIWNDDSRPYYGITMGIYTLFQLRKRNPGLISDDAFNVYMQALFNWPTLRKFYSRRGNNHAKCLCHGDAHIGNFFVAADKTIGMFDFQVLSEEHPMRDVSYFLMSSYPPDNLARDEKPLITFYMEQLRSNGVKDLPSFDNFYLHYRMQSWYALYAFVFSGGFSNLMDSYQTHCGVTRILKAMDRINAAGALYDLLDGTLDDF